MRRPILGLALLVCGCSPESKPARVFVPGPSFTQVVRISSAQGDAPQIAVGQPLVLHAIRRSGPWVPARGADLAADACWVAQDPGEEPEVSDNLRWIAEPDGPASFNVAYRSDHTREVQFSTPGQYRLRATSALWCKPDTESNAITVSVTPR